MPITKRLLVFLTVTGWLLLGGTAQADPIVDFEINPGGSSVSVSSLSVTSSATGGVDATIALPDSSFSLGVGETRSFDFITWTPTIGAGLFSFDVDATLAFTEPLGLETTSSGQGGAFVASGAIRAGILFWDDVPTTVTLFDGTVVGVDFQDGIALRAGDSITTTASVTVISAGGSASAMPEPSSAALLGIGGFLVARRLRSKRW